ncbi:hypothetical protein [Serinibacter arcticus]|uniref:hypothetical protein n=1 Tax=Serinibacter arcticus TaxID=1655435 RepID=UPI0011B22F9D|nr:hypothetical protein [Serinibacter arcticus]
MSDRPRDDEQGTDRGSVDPYSYLTAGGQEGASYLPGDVAAERAAAAPAPGEPAPTAPSDDLDVSVGMTRRELRELRLRRAQRAAQDESSEAPEPVAAAAEPEIARSQEDDGDAVPAQLNEDRTAVLPIVPAGYPSTTTTAASSTEGSSTDAGSPELGFGVPASSPAPWGSSATTDGSPTDRSTTDDAPADGAAALAPGWHDPAAGRSRRRLPLIIAAVVAVVVTAVVAIVLLLNRGGDGGEEPTTAPTTAEAEPTGLAAVLPTSVSGGEFSEEGATGVTYSLTADGLVPNTAAPAGSTESLVGVYAGGVEDITLTGSTFATTQEALDAATAESAALGTPLETGVVFPDQNIGTYWAYNNDGLVTYLWHDGESGLYTVVSESPEDALGFYTGLDF